MRPSSKIDLSFFPINHKYFTFNIFRQKAHQNDERIDFPNAINRSLPVQPISNISEHSDAIYDKYWVRFDEAKDYEPYICEFDTNNYLTLDYIYYLLRSKCAENLSDNKYFSGKHFRDKWTAFVIESFPEGKRTVSLEPYYLRSKGILGFLVDFRFRSNPNIPFSKRIQQLSLSIDANGRTNKNSYADRYTQIQKFIELFASDLFQLTDEIAIEPNFISLEAENLETKQYVFANDKLASSQFKGIKTYKPILSVNDDTKIYFLYRKYEKPFADNLYLALKGRTFNYNFPGMEAMFQYPFGGNNVSGTALSGYNQGELEKAITFIKNDANGRPVVPIMIVPFSRFDDSNSNDYYIAKHTFLKHDMASQFVSLRLLKNKNQLKWAISNIGLQLFAKMGGQPWHVKPKTKNCLIIGIGQSHKKSKFGIEKYFAYSILTESTGIYKELQVLGETTDTGTYYESFKRNLKSAIERYYDQYDSFVVHTTFKIRYEEMDAVKEVLETINREHNTTKQFVLMKFNDKNKYFGYSSTSNSMIPYESSYIQLSFTDYLVWFEGLQYHNTTVHKKVERPVHIEFIQGNELSKSQKTDYLQDALNISGANWRGFNAKSLPISIHYAYLVAEYYKEFQSLNLEYINFEAIRPWFL